MNNEQNLSTSPYISDLALVSFEIKQKKSICMYLKAVCSITLM